MSSRENGNGGEIIPSLWKKDLPVKRGKRRGPGASARPASPSFTGYKGYLSGPLNRDVSLKCII